MSKIKPEGPNAEQIEFWNGEGGDRFIAFQNALDVMLEPFSRATIERLGIKSGEVVLDIGCGCGDTTIDLARRVGAKGEAIGVDISEPMLARAEEAAANAELTNVFFEAVDVETGNLHRDSFDAAFSRFGVMFFRHPEVAFRNVYNVLHDSGRIGFACWQAIDKNPWIGLQMQAVMPFVAEPPAPPGPEDPGPFSLSDPDRIRRILGDAGFKNIEIEAFEPEMILGATRDLDDAVEFGLGIGPAGSLLKDADAETQAKAARAVRDSLVPFHTERGVATQSSTWIVTASK
ncbi:MAG: methyltransferase domain-containing protein [Proteobacteria bacterium]|nr:methyltransferase domain-containing protein [Pseudomonadota bacterium]